MDFDKANEWLRDKNKHMDLEVLVEASRKWKQRKLVTSSAQNIIPSLCESGKDLIDYILTYKSLIDTHINRSLHDLPKHVNLVCGFLRACVDKKSIRSCNTELQHILNFDRDIRKKFEKHQRSFTKYNAILEIWQGNFNDNYTIEKMLEEESMMRFSFAYDLFQNFVYTGPVKLDRKKNKDSAKIIFTKEEMVELQKQILQISQMDFLKSTNTINITIKDAFDNADKQLTSMRVKAKNFENENEELHLIYRLIKHPSQAPAYIENENGYFTTYFKTDVTHFIQLIKEVIKLMEKTDSFLGSKNV